MGGAGPGGEGLGRLVAAVGLWERERIVSSQFDIMLAFPCVCDYVGLGNCDSLWEGVSLAFCM